MKDREKLNELVVMFLKENGTSSARQIYSELGFKEVKIQTGIKTFRSFAKIINEFPEIDSVRTRKPALYFLTK